MRRGARVLLYLVTAGVVLALGKFHAAAIGNYDFTDSYRFTWAVAYVALLCIAAFAVGLPDLPRNAYQALIAAAGATFAAAVGISVLQLLVGSLLLPRFVIFWSALFLIPIYALCAFVAHRGRRRGEGRDRVVAVAGPDEVAAFVAELARQPERPASLVWALAPDDPEMDLVDAVTEMNATVLVLDREAQNDDRIVGQAAGLHERGVRVRTLSLFYDEWLGKLPLGELERMSLMFDIGEIHRVRYGRLKRLMDVTLGMIGMPFLVLSLPFVFVGNLVANRGPIFYRQERVGKGSKPFRIVKFRTMRPDAGPTTWTTEDDPRITPFGRFLRKTHLDELPQAWNVLRGDLAFVGPRPEQPQYVDELVEKVPFYNLRHLVRPGLTGWAQVKYPYGASEIDAMEKLQYEFYYLRHQSLTLDLRIIGRTLRTFFGGR